MRVKQKPILLWGYVLLCVLAAQSAVGAKPAPVNRSSAPLINTAQSAEYLPFAAWSHPRNHRFTVISDSEKFDLPVTDEFLESFCRAFVDTFRKAGFRTAPLHDRLVWICLTNPENYRDYSMFADGMNLSSLDSYYSAQTNRVAFRWIEKKEKHDNVQFAVIEAALSGSPSGTGEELLRKITHELAHQLAFNCGIQKPGILYPLWVAEGLALNFEMETSFPNHISLNSERKQRLMKLRKEANLLPLEYLVTVSRLPQSNEDRCDLYAECWGFFHFLFYKHPDQFRKYMEALAQLEPGYRGPDQLLREFEAFFGNVRQYELPWKHFLAEQSEVICRGEPQVNPE